jgi:hypothetical protein
MFQRVAQLVVVVGVAYMLLSWFFWAKKTSKKAECGCNHEKKSGTKDGKSRT